MRKPELLKSAGALRCAIYTRKSTEEGLEQEFNSLDAQREACEAYITSQRHAGWVAVLDMYDDGGLSGGSMERPALRRLLTDIKAGKVQIVVVYKVDRLTRSLADFAKIVDVLDAHNASFVSVTQQFNTTTSMGRLTLNMLLSFAQFEREIAGERIRDKIAASKAKGMWMGGTVPLGYDVHERKLIVNPTEADTVRLIFQRYLELGSVALLRTELDQRNIRSKRRVSAGGRVGGGQKIYRGALYLILQNRLYRGEVSHNGKIYPGQHEAIVDLALWQKVQDRLAGNRNDRAICVGAEEPSLLSGLIFDRDGKRMTPTHAVKKGKRYRYYVSATLITAPRSDHLQGRRIPAGDTEALVLDRLRCFFASEKDVGDAIAPFNLDGLRQRAVLGWSAKMAGRWAVLPPIKVRNLVKSIVLRVEVSDAAIQVYVDLMAFIAKATPNLVEGPTKDRTRVEPLVLRIEAQLRRAGKGTRLVIGPGVANSIDVDLVALLARAHAARLALESGNDACIEAMAARFKGRRDHFGALIRISYLSPNLVRAILSGEQPVELSPRRLVTLCKDLPHDWKQQRAYLGFAR